MFAVTRPGWTTTACRLRFGRSGGHALAGTRQASSAAGTDFARLEALRARDGKLMWRTPALGQDIFDTAAVSGGLVYIGIAGVLSGVQAFNATTGKHVWTFSLPGHGAEAQPTVANGVVYIANSDNVDN